MASTIETVMPARTVQTDALIEPVADWQPQALKDIRIACVDGFKGFPDAITTAYPQTQIQLCIVHGVRNALNRFTIVFEARIAQFS